MLHANVTVEPATCDSWYIIDEEMYPLIGTSSCGHNLTANNMVSESQHSPNSAPLGCDSHIEK
jgi:hypothetical protein